MTTAPLIAIEMRMAFPDLFSIALEILARKYCGAPYRHRRVTPTRTSGTERPLWERWQCRACTFGPMATNEPKLSKREVLRTLKSMPDEFVAEDLIERIVLMEKIARGLTDSAAGRVLTGKQMDEEIRRWSK